MAEIHFPPANQEITNKEYMRPITILIPLESISAYANHILTMECRAMPQNEILQECTQKNKCSSRRNKKGKKNKNGTEPSTYAFLIDKIQSENGNLVITIRQSCTASNHGAEYFRFSILAQLGESQHAIWIADLKPRLMAQEHKNKRKQDRAEIHSETLPTYSKKNKQCIVPHTIELNRTEDLTFAPYTEGFEPEFDSDESNSSSDFEETETPTVEDADMELLAKRVQNSLYLSCHQQHASLTNPLFTRKYNIRLDGHKFDGKTAVFDDLCCIRDHPQRKQYSQMFQRREYQPFVFIKFLDRNRNEIDAQQFQLETPEGGNYSPAFGVSLVLRLANTYMDDLIFVRAVIVVSRKTETEYGAYLDLRDNDLSLKLVPQ
eukprot:TRINITY_DN2725_c0_g1_i1.p1 TRINITY_DN2725_c0_g1~~TRINITY_DN2725_c0_g1_i1.p1  ORF type:complete len:377 (+),score=67.50 TRINITY_DN2725_c0_g1_i1:103-1233(+)